MITMHVSKVVAIQPGIARFHIQDNYGQYEIAVNLNEVSATDLAQHLYQKVLELRPTYELVGAYQQLKVSDIAELSHRKKVIDGEEYQLAYGETNVSK